MKCKVCEKESPATLCNICFLEEVISAVERGEDDPSRILKGMVIQYGRLKNLKRLPSYKAIFGPRRLRRIITTEAGERCRLVQSYDGWVAVTAGPRSEAVTRETPEGKITRYPGESTEGGRVITYYEGDTPVKEIHLPTSLVFPRKRSIKKSRYISSGPPAIHLKSPIVHKRPPSPLDK